MPGDVVEDVGLGEVIQAIGRADRDCGRKLAAFQASKKRNPGRSR